MEKGVFLVIKVCRKPWLAADQILLGGNYLLTLKVATPQLFFFFGCVCAFIALKGHPLFFLGVSAVWRN